MGLVYRCLECQKEMVLESYHRGRTVHCPHCSELNQVPQSLEFREATRATLSDANVGGWLLMFAIFSSCLGCVPLTGGVWWYAWGRIHRARNEEREVDAAMLWALRCAGVATVLWTLAWSGVLMKRFL